MEISARNRRIPTVEALRGEIGASMVKSRIMETTFSYLIDKTASEFTNLRK